MKYFLLIILFLFSFNLSAQRCSNNVEETSPTSDFTLNSDGTAINLTTNLMWMRCSLGQQWNGQTCENDDNKVDYYSIYSLPTIASDFSYAGYSDWRLPDIKELESLVELACYNPAINIEVFPETESTTFLTSTYVGKYQVRNVDFSQGAIYGSSVPAVFRARIRLVRDM